jgi:hypothetical protein
MIGNCAFWQQTKIPWGQHSPFGDFSDTHARRKLLGRPPASVIEGYFRTQRTMRATQKSWTPICRIQIVAQITENVESIRPWKPPAGARCPPQVIAKSY